MHYYPHHIGDFISDTARLNDSQCMAYLRLIWHYYDTEKPLENDPESLAFKIGASVIDVNLILKHYFTFDGDCWRKTRCDSVISEYHSKADKARKSAEARWKSPKPKQSDSERNANASNSNANEPKIDANQEPITNNQEPIIKDRPIGKPLVTFNRWMEIIKESGEKPIPDGNSIFEYAQDAGIESDYLRLAWVEFKARYSNETKKYKDWRIVFGKSVRENWFRFWWIDGTEYKLTSKGQQAMIAMKSRDDRGEK